MYVKAFIPKGTEYVASFNDMPYKTYKDYYTTVDVQEQDLNNDHWIKHLARINLSKTIAQKEFVNIKLYKTIWLDACDIQIIR